MYRKYLHLLLIYLCPGGFMACTGGNTQTSPHTIPPSKDTSMVYIQNERLKLGVDITLGGAITYLSDKANGGENRYRCPFIADPGHILVQMAKGLRLNGKG